MLNKNLIPIIFTFMIFSSSLTQECLSLEEFKNTKTDLNAMKRYINKVVFEIQSSEITKYFGTKIKYIAEGSFGKVYKYHSPKGVDIAVKMIKKKEDKHTRRIDFDYHSLFMEIHSNSCLVDLINKNSNYSKMFVILKGVFYIKDIDNYAMVMDFYNQDLDNYLKDKLDKPYDLCNTNEQAQMEHLIKKLADILYIMHKNNLAHRDLKPENIIVNNGNPMFIDFGMTTPEANFFSTIGGTPFYIDPNLLKTNAGGKQTDVYALGIIFYVILKGPSAYTALDLMLREGNWQVPNKTYNPNTNNLRFPKKYQALKSMLSMSQSRPTIGQVVTMIEEIQNSDQNSRFGQQDAYPQKEKIPTRDFYGLNVKHRVEIYEENHFPKNQQMGMQKQIINNHYPQKEYKDNRYAKQEVNQNEYHNVRRKVYPVQEIQANHHYQAQPKYQVQQTHQKQIPLKEQLNEFQRLRLEANKNRANANRVNNIFLI